MRYVPEEVGAEISSYSKLRVFKHPANIPPLADDYRVMSSPLTRLAVMLDVKLPDVLYPTLVDFALNRCWA